MTKPEIDAEGLLPTAKRSAYWTFDEKAAETVGNLYYFAPLDRSPPPYLTQRRVEAIIDIAADGTLAGVELIDNMPPPPRAAARTSDAVEPVAFQQRVAPWMDVCFGPEISGDRLERGDRFLEEALELLQSGGYPRERIAALTDYVFDRPQGEINQEVGGVMVTLAAYCLAFGLDMHAAGETELARIWTKVEKIRAKQAAKPTGSALPVAAPHPSPVSEEMVEEVKRALIDARTELFEAADKFSVIHHNHPGAAADKGIGKYQAEDKAFCAELSDRMTAAASRARATLSPAVKENDRG